ncbi:ATP-binding cassette domain-containing protein [Metalysinibacillus jejuensis]|uniref:ATP-binding cassette domain-containing protein n=1 Tax=Metalysinibacillus jejuensis TaxID=914327 RepID=UPI000D3A977B|nr:ATP-binding cassette domain-containing protein [Metalysinibacillus jejuensis]
MDYVLQVQGLTKKYHQNTVINDLHMSVPKGAIYGFVGKNGAGKTTLIRLICGLQEPTAGAYTLYGTNHHESDISTTRRRIGAVIEGPSIYMNMTAEDNLKVQYRVLGLPSFDWIPTLLRLVGLEHTGKKKAKHFSLGMRQRLGIAVALCGNPDFLVLDEPMNGLDPKGIIEMRELILKLNREQQITILISSHILDELARVATHYGFIDNGKMIQEISSTELEKAFRKCTRIKVTNMGVLTRVLDSMQQEYTVVSEEAVNVFGEVHITPLVLRLANEHCNVLSIHELDESLEHYYLNIVGGAKHA